MTEPPPAVPPPAVCDAPPEPSARRGPNLVLAGLVAVLVAVAVVAVAVGQPRPVAGTATPAPSGAPLTRPANLALVDPAVTTSALNQVDGIIAAVFSYDYTNIDATERAARDGLVGAAATEYTGAMATVHQQAAARHLVLTTTVSDSALIRLTDRHAELVVVAMQHSTPAGGATTNQLSAIVVVADQVAGRWRVSDIRTQLAGRQQPPVAGAGSPGRPPTEQQVADQRDQALAAGEHAAEVLTTFDWRRVEEGIAAWRAVATGALLDQFAGDNSATVQRVVAARTASTGTAVAAGVGHLDPGNGTATVLAVSSVSVDADGTTSVKVVPLSIALTRTPAGWRASGITELTAP